MDPDAPPPAAEPTGGGKAGSEPSARTRKVKISTTLDPADEGEVEHLDPDVVDAHFAAMERRRG